MNPGKLNTKITLQYPSGTTVVDGIEKPNYVDGATPWAEFDVKPPRGQEIFAAQAEHSVQTRWIKIRYMRGITSQWRVKVRISPTQDQIYEVIGQPIDLGMKHLELYLQLKAVE
jgi:SPP1 family predicted phage head-tail adaptor